MPTHNGSVYIEHTFNQSGKFVGLVTVGDRLFIRYASLDASGNSNDIANRHSCEQKGQDSLVRLLCRRGHLYRSCRYALRGIDLACSGMDLRHQCAVGLLLCLGGLETRKMKQS